MTLNEKFGDAARFAGCEQELLEYDAVIDVLKKSGKKNIAVLGETNSGKTSFINFMAGQEVRKPTKISLGETPLMVTFGQADSREGFECVNISQANEGLSELAFYEIPLNQAIDTQKGKPAPLLETMDAVIYVISAIMPFSDSDAKSLEALVDRFPLLLWISKTDILDGQTEYEDCVEYIRESFSARFEGSFCKFYDRNDENAFEKIVEDFQNMSLSEIREYHISQVVQTVREMLEGRLRGMLDEARKKRNGLEEQKLEQDALYRQQQVIWDSIRIVMLEKEQETIDEANKIITQTSIVAKKQAMNRLKEASSKKEWLSEDFKPFLENAMNTAVQKILSEIQDRVSAHRAWLVSEVNRRFGFIMTVDDMNRRFASSASEIGECDARMSYLKMGIAAGAGAVAGGAILSGLSLLPTCVIAIPASVVMLGMLKGSMGDYDSYTQKLERFIDDCCDRNFRKLSSEVRQYILMYYYSINEDIVKLASQKQSVEGNAGLAGGIDEEMHKIQTMLQQLNADE